MGTFRRSERNHLSPQSPLVCETLANHPARDNSLWSSELFSPNTPFHRIVTGYWCQGGDVTNFNGSGRASIFDQSFVNENFNLRHAGPGILSMCNDDENKNDSKFNLTFRRLETMDGKHVVFGKVISGLSNIYKIEEFGTKTGKPIKTIIVANCGIISKKHKRYPPEIMNDVENT
ncbi:peptidyl-prolyl cis-trans isomerase A-like [Hylaeus volcanicus]|uniref:peptidyl-prolyl cis-trans isomerase A-like n=1 Tax=Hylaeus volcanicus TaxID=313075 RepID=UPI0023B77F82|nr:peptidyl-prolyl cis-trans isomerase A-like [Hylaeus volcanicus]